MGMAGAEVVLRDTAHGHREIDCLLVVDAMDVRAICDDGDIVGCRFTRVKNKPHVDLRFPYCIFHAHDPMPGQIYGWSILRAAFSPWFDKHCVGGALDVRRLFMKKDAYRGARFTVPDGFTPMKKPDGTVENVPNSDIAMKLLESIASGGVFYIPGSKNSDGSPKWEYSESTVASNPAHIFQYCTECDKEMVNALGIADDVIKSEATGAWNGKAVPMQATYCIIEQELVRLLRSVDRVIKPLVVMNFGPANNTKLKRNPWRNRPSINKTAARQRTPANNRRAATIRADSASSNCHADFNSHSNRNEWGSIHSKPLAKACCQPVSLSKRSKRSWVV